MMLSPLPVFFSRVAPARLLKTAEPPPAAIPKLPAISKMAPFSLLIVAPVPVPEIAQSA